MTAYNQSAGILVVKYINHLWCSQLQLLVKIRWVWLYLISFSLICLCWKTLKQKSHRIFVLKIMYHEKTGPPTKQVPGLHFWGRIFPDLDVIDARYVNCPNAAHCGLPPTPLEQLWQHPTTTMLNFWRVKYTKKASITDGYSFVRYVCCKLHFLCETRKCVVWPS